MLRALLLCAVEFYRRRLSGRGPFAGVRCTFEHQESCSAYGKRVLEESPSVAIAVSRIVRRLARCRHLSLYRTSEGGVGWGQGYDAVVEAIDAASALGRLDARLAVDAEGHPVCAAVRRAAGLVRAASRGMTPPPTTAGVLPLRRDATRIQAALRRRLLTRGAATLLLAAASAALGVSGLIDLALAVGAVSALPLWSALAAWRLHQRLAELDVLAALDARLGKASISCQGRG